MSRSRLVRVLVLCTVLTLAAQAAWAGPAKSGGSSGSAWALLMQLWSSITTNVGCILDPHGTCGAGQPPEPSSLIDEGCWIDPNGRCRAGS